MFVQYYSQLMSTLRNHTEELISFSLATDSIISFSWRTDSNVNSLILDYVRKMSNKDVTKAEFWLARISMQLYYFYTKLFYKMLEFMESYERDRGVQRLAAEIHTKVKEFDPLMSSGMCA